jgi:hypothetical protein
MACLLDIFRLSSEEFKLQRIPKKLQEAAKSLSSSKIFKDLVRTDDEKNNHLLLNL